MFQTDQQSSSRSDGTEINCSDDETAERYDQVRIYMHELIRRLIIQSNYLRLNEGIHERNLRTSLRGLLDRRRDSLVERKRRLEI
jgi:hypothetical protein